jgi:light-regulated signal transduction histidine kinase (bacteriophytochrome)
MLVRDLLAYTQIDNQRAPAHNIVAEQALGHALANLGGAIEESHAEIGFDSLPTVCMDETHLRQLFQNLIGNAIKYRHPGRPCVVQISAGRQGAYWVFSVRDNGLGIEQQYHDQIFGLFTRLHGEDAREGTGLGLAICKRIVERYHGRFGSTESGKGSDFRFTISA